MEIDNKNLTPIVAIHIHPSIRSHLETLMPDKFKELPIINDVELDSFAIKRQHHALRRTRKMLGEQINMKPNEEKIMEELANPTESISSEFICCGKPFKNAHGVLVHQRRMKCQTSSVKESPKEKYVTPEVKAYDIKSAYPFKLVNELNKHESTDELVINAAHLDIILKCLKDAWSGEGVEYTNKDREDAARAWTRLS